MPKERRSRTFGHEPSVKVPSKRQFAVQSNAVHHVDVGSSANISGDDLLQELGDDPTSEPRNLLKKKDKQMMKHELFLQRLDASRAPYSKSHARRIKRKEREDIAGGLGAIKAALSSMEGADIPFNPTTATSNEIADDGVKDAKDEQQGSSAKRSVIVQRRPGQIGEGKGAPLTKAQRKQALKAERLRQPLILSNPDFAANPFKTIRLHAQNTLIPHEKSDST